MGITVSNQPPYSPNLDPIKNAQQELKKTVYKLFLELRNCRGKLVEDRKIIEKALQEAQAKILQSYIDSLIESIKDRVTACIKAKGQHTKYQKIFEICYVLR